MPSLKTMTLEKLKSKYKYIPIKYNMCICVKIYLQTNLTQTHKAISILHIIHTRNQRKRKHYLYRHLCLHITQIIHNFNGFKITFFK